MFGFKAGKYSVEEVDYALDRVKRNGTGVPVINVFFRNPREGEEIDCSVEELRARLDEKYVHHVDGRFFLGNIKLRIVQDISVLTKELFPVSIAIDEKPDSKYEYSMRLVDKMILNLDETDLFETDEELKETRSEYEKERDASRKKDIRMRLERLVATRLGFY